MEAKKDFGKTFKTIALVLGLIPSIACITHTKNDLFDIILGVFLAFMPFAIYILYIRLKDWSFEQYSGALIAVALPQAWIYYMSFAGRFGSIADGAIVFVVLILTYPLAMLGGWIGSKVSKKNP